MDMKKFGSFLVIGLSILASCGGSTEPSDTTLSSDEIDNQASGSTANDDAVNDDAASTTSRVESPETAERPTVTIPDEFNDPEDEILATYLAYHEARLIAWGEPEADPDYAPLYELVVDPEASNIREGIEKKKAAGEIIVDPPNSDSSHSVRFVGAFDPTKTEGNSVTLIDCFVDATEVRTLDGEVLESDPITFVLAIEMRVVDGAWKVAARDVKETYTGVSECEEYANV